MRHLAVFLTVASATALVVACHGSTPPKPVEQVAIGSSSSAPAGSLPPITVVPPDPGAADAEETRRVHKMVKIVSSVRGLNAKTEVPGKVLGRDALIARVKQHVQNDVPAVAMTNEGLVYQLLGLVPGNGWDYPKEVFALLEQQLAGYYEPADGTMYMAADLEDELASATLAHELDHALQDQYWDLKTRSKYTAGRSDAATAQQCVAEGDAMAVMIDVMFRDRGVTSTVLPDDQIDAETLLGLDPTAAGSTSPHFLRASLVAPYVEGLRFINARRRAGGWAAVNASWDRAPATTEQVLHPDKWDANEPALAIPTPTFATLGKDWTLSDQDTLGELMLRQVLTEWMPEPKAKSAASNWGGDHTALVKKGDLVALAWKVRWDEAKSPRTANAFAADAWATLAPAFATKFAATVKEPTFECAPRTDVGPIAIATKGRDVVVLAGPTTFKDLKFTPGGDCALAKKWAAELLK
jgi:hypothetical protein